MISAPRRRVNPVACASACIAASAEEASLKRSLAPEFSKIPPLIQVTQSPEVFPHPRHLHSSASNDKTPNSSGGRMKITIPKKLVTVSDS